MKKIIQDYFNEHHELFKKMDTLIESIMQAVNLMRCILDKNGKILVCGNGGSATDSQHFVGELVGRFKMERKAIPALSLADNSAILTAVANDYDFTRIFARQVEAYGNPGDILVAISTSGTSANVLEAIKIAKSKGLIIIGLTGKNGMKIECDCLIAVDSLQTEHVQEMHITIIHVICLLLENMASSNK